VRSRTKLDIKYLKNIISAKKNSYLEFLFAHLPLTKEAEITIRLSETERKLQGHNLILPSHLFVAALKNKDSKLFECFKKDTQIIEKLVNYYKSLNQNNSAEIKIEKAKYLGKYNLDFLCKIKKKLGLTK
jgi:BarA-like signal transduction histidine kinase